MDNTLVNLVKCSRVITNIAEVITWNIMPTIGMSQIMFPSSDQRKLLTEMKYSSENTRLSFKPQNVCSFSTIPICGVRNVIASILFLRFMDTSFHIFLYLGQITRSVESKQLSHTLNGKLELTLSNILNTLYNQIVLNINLKSSQNHLCNLLNTTRTNWSVYKVHTRFFNF